VDAAMNVCVDGICAAFSGTYFSNGSTIESAAAALAINDLSVTFEGTAWLKFDNKGVTPDGTASSNTRFKRQDDKLSGTGSFVINGHVIVITDVTQFIPNEECGIPGDPCAVITFTATVDGTPGHQGETTAFDKSTCTLYTGEGSQYFCGSGD
jgi:hypothetical protein